MNDVHDMKLALAGQYVMFAFTYSGRNRMAFSTLALLGFNSD